MKIMNSRYGRTVMAFALTGTLALILTACGGSGGGSSGGNNGGGGTPPPTATITLVSASPANGLTGVATKGDAVVVVSFTNAGTFSKLLDVTCNAKSAKTAETEALDPIKGQLTYTVSYDAPASTVCTLSVNVSAKGTGGASDPAPVVVSNSFTTAVKLTYDNVHVAVRYHFLGRIDANGQFVQAMNNTGRATGNFKRVDGVYIAEEPLAGSCLYPALSRMTDDFKYYVVAYNPVADSFVLYNGTLPAGYEYTNDTNGGLSVVGAKWHNAQRYYGYLGQKDWGTPPYDYMVAWTPDGVGGWFYVANPDQGPLHHLFANGSDSITYPKQPDNGEFMVMNNISCHP